MIKITIYKGNTETINVNLTQSGVAYPLTDLKLKFIAKKTFTDLDADALINKEFVIDDPSSGIGILSLLHTDTDIPARTYQSEIKLYKSDGTFIKTIDVGTLVISEVVLKEV